MTVVVVLLVIVNIGLILNGYINRKSIHEQYEMINNHINQYRKDRANSVVASVLENMSKHLAAAAQELKK